MASHLTGLQQIPLQGLFHETRAFEYEDFDYLQNNVNWTLVTVILIASASLITIIVWLLWYKVNSW